MSDEFTIEAQNDDGETYYFVWLPDGETGDGYGEHGLRAIGTLIRKALSNLKSTAEFDAAREDQLNAYANSLAPGVTAVLKFRGSDFHGGTLVGTETGHSIDTIDPDDLAYLASTP